MVPPQSSWSGLGIAEEGREGGREGREGREGGREGDGKTEKGGDSRRRINFSLSLEWQLVAAKKCSRHCDRKMKNRESFILASA